MTKPDPAIPKSMPDSRAHRSPDGSRGRNHSWLITRLGLGLAVLLWFGPGLYFQKMHQIWEIDYQSGAISKSDHDAIIRRDTLYLIAARVGACIILLGSILYLLSQIDLRKDRRHDNVDS